MSRFEPVAGATSDLVEFLRSRLDEDETVARGAVTAPWRYSSRKAWHSPPPAFGVRTSPEEYVAAGPSEAPICVAATGPADDPQSMADARHVARWDPARVLAEAAAARLLIGRYEVWADKTQEPARTVGVVLGGALRDRVQVYADHPDFDPAWRLG